MSQLRQATLFLALLAGCALPAPGTAQVDGVFVQSTPQHSAPDYDSDYGAEQRLLGSDNTPEADARPGVQFFIKGVQAFRKHDYKFAIDMYRVAASWAYKPAEYNLGVMYARGQGVAVDLPRALAWMALAAERGEKHYVETREVIYALMTKEQFDQANVIWRELKKTYGDKVALKRAKARWAEVRSHITGSRVGFVGNLKVGSPEPGLGNQNGPKVANALARDFPQHRSDATTSGEVLGGSGVDGSIAYRQLLQSDNPYDPKFANLPGGTAIVGPPETVKPSANGKKHDATPPRGDHD